MAIVHNFTNYKIILQSWLCHSPELIQVTHITHIIHLIHLIHLIHIDFKLQIAHLNVSQVYEWLPFSKGYEAEVPESEEERFEWLKGPYKITPESTDEEILKADRGGSGYDLRNAQTASRFRKELIARYGEERGSKIRYAEAFQVCPYGGTLTEELKEKLFSF